MTPPRRGQVFTHHRMLDMTWTPTPGQTRADNPHARCVVTAVQRGNVYFAYATEDDNPAIPRGRFFMSRAAWDRDYTEDNS